MDDGRRFEGLSPDGGPPKGPIWVGALLFWGAGFALYFGADVALLDAILLAVMLVVLPAFALGQASALGRLPFERTHAYWSSIGTLWVLGATAWLVGTRNDGVSAIGLVPLPLLALVGWSVALTVVGVGVMLLSRIVGRWAGVRETPVLAKLLPQTRRERRLFALLSVAAGVGEEVAYRGYAIPVLAAGIGGAWSVVLTSGVFGVLHAYQGAIGVVRTAVMGGVLAGGFLLSGSLVPAVIAHVLVDLIGGLVIADWFDESKTLAETTVRVDEY